MDDYIVKCNHTDNDTIMNNNRNQVIESKSPEEGINETTKRNVLNREYKSGTVGNELIKEGCVF